MAEEDTEKSQEKAWQERRHGVTKVVELPSSVKELKVLGKDSLEDEIDEDELQKFAEFVTGIPSDGTSASAPVLERDTTAQQTVRELPRDSESRETEEEVRSFYETAGNRGPYAGTTMTSGREDPRTGTGQRSYAASGKILPEDTSQQAVSAPSNAPSLERRNILRGAQTIDQFQQEQLHRPISDTHDDKYSLSEQQPSERRERARYPWEID